MVSIFRRSPSCFFACTWLQMRSCLPRAGAALPRSCQGSGIAFAPRLLLGGSHGKLGEFGFLAL